MDRLQAHKGLKQTLKAQGYSLTSPRKVVFDVLLQREPQFMHEIVSRVGSAVNRASVYRIIDLFEKLGIVVRLPLGWKYKLELSDAFSEHHHHITCSNCGRLVPIHENASLERQITELAQAEGFAPSSHQLEINGLCPECQITK